MKKLSFPFRSEINKGEDMYIISGSFTMVVQALIAGAAFIPFVLVMFRGRIKSWFNRNKKSSEKSQASVTPPAKS
jgi:hypothetical protein